jgi:hypothetical protein
LTLKCDELLSSSAFEFSLRRYSVESSPYTFNMMVPERRRTLCEVTVVGGGWGI